MKQPVIARALPAIFIGGFITLAACSKSENAAASEGSTQTASAPAATAASDEQLQDITRYRLTMDNIDKYMAAQRNMALKVKDLSPDERKAMEARGDNASDADASIDDMAKKFDSEPIMKNAIHDAGLSTREFVMITMSMMQSGMAAGVLKMRPNDNQDSLIRAMQANPENVKFFQDHEAEITQKQKAIEAEMKKAGVPNEG